MANSDAAFGLKPVGDRPGGPYNGSVNKYYIPSTDGTAAYIGGVVKLAGSASASGIPTVTANCSAHDVLVGVIVGFDQVEGVTNPNLNQQYRPASTAMYVWVADDPEAVFEVQEDSDGAALAATNVGQNADLINLTSGSTVWGTSTMELDSSTANTTATLDVQILRLAQRTDNAIGTNAKWLVKLNNHQFVDGTTGI